MFFKVVKFRGYTVAISAQTHEIFMAKFREQKLSDMFASNHFSTTHSTQHF